MSLLKDFSATLAVLGILIVISLGLMFGVNSCSASIWNDGVCTNCETKYELKGVSNGLKYYSCPDCGQEVNRY